MLEICPAEDRLCANQPAGRFLTRGRRSCFGFWFGCWFGLWLRRSLQRLPVAGQGAAASLISALFDHGLPIVTCRQHSKYKQG